MNKVIPPATIPALKGKAHDDVVKAIDQLARMNRDLQSQVHSLHNAGFITKDEAHQKYGAQAQRQALQAGGAHSVNVTGMLGSLAQPQLTGIPDLTRLPNHGSPYAQDGVVVTVTGSKYIYRIKPTPGWVAF